MSHAQPRHRPDGSRRRGAALGLALTLLVLGWGPPAASAAGAKPEAGFALFEAAWEARSAVSICACIEDRGKVIFSLFAYPLSGKVRVMGPEQAKEALKIYFRRIAYVALKDVTPKRSPKNVRLYEYAYKASRENARTTHLQVKLKQDKNRQWVLASVTESARPRPR